MELNEILNGLSGANDGCNDNCGPGNRGFGGSWIWIIFLFLIFGCGGCGFGGGYGAGGYGAGYPQINPCCCNVKKTKHGCCKQTCYYPQQNPCCPSPMMGGYGGYPGGYGAGCGFGGYGGYWIWFLIIILFFCSGSFGRGNNCGCNNNNVCATDC